MLFCNILDPVSAAHTSISRMDSNSTSYRLLGQVMSLEEVEGGVDLRVRNISSVNLSLFGLREHV